MNEAERSKFGSARVVKLGGSLLDWHAWPRANYACWLDRQSPATTVLITGGGALAETIRHWDATFGLDAKTAHWLAIDTMQTTARLAASLLDGSTLVEKWDALIEQLGEPQRLSGRRPIVFAPREFLERIELTLPGTPLPESWAVTSDSIAARLAVALNANELVLLKSALPPTVHVDDQLFIAHASRTGYVDAFFPTAAESIPVVRCVNLRDREFAEFVPDKAA